MVELSLIYSSRWTWGPILLILMVHSRKHVISSVGLWVMYLLWHILWFFPYDRFLLCRWIVRISPFFRSSADNHDFHTDEIHFIVFNRYVTEICYLLLHSLFSLFYFCFNNWFCFPQTRRQKQFVVVCSGWSDKIPFQY